MDLLFRETLPDKRRQASEAKTVTAVVIVINFSARPGMVRVETGHAGIAKLQDLFFQGDGGFAADNPDHLDFRPVLYLYPGQNQHLCQ